MEDKLELQEPGESRPVRRKRTPLEARSHYENLTLIFAALVWWFGRDGWFNTNAEMLKHQGFNRLGTVVFGALLVYAGVRWLASAVMAARGGAGEFDHELIRDANRRRAIGVGVAFALFAFLCWGNADIAPAFNRISAVIAILLLPVYGYRWRRSAQAQAVPATGPRPDEPRL
jgi:hypothetical protein